MKKIIIVISSACTLCTLGLLVYFIFIHRSVTSYLELARTAMQAGKINIAQKNFLEVIKRDNANEAAYNALAEIAERNKKPALAAGYWEIAASLNPLSAELQEKYINALLEAYQYPAVTRQLENKKVADLSKFELYALTKASYFQETAAKTKKLLTELLKRSPKDPKVVLLHANILLSAQEIKKSSKLFDSLSNCPDKKIRTDALIGLAYTELMFKKIKKAGLCYKKAAETSPDSMRVLMILANYNLKYGKPKLAKTQYQQLHKRFPENIIITIILAELYAKDKNTVAITKLLKHIKAANQNAIAAKYYLHALLAYIANDYKKTQQNLRLCTVFNYRPLYAYLQFQEILASNDIPRINRHLTGLLKINDSQVARTDLCSQIEQLAIKNFKDNDYKTAAALAVIIRDSFPEKTRYIHLAMVCAFNKQNWDMAVSEADKFNDASPDTLDYLSIKGRSLLYLNQAKEALPLLKKLTVLTPKDPKAWLWLAQNYQLLGKQKQIEACIGKMLRFAGDSHSVIDPAVTFFIARNNMKIANKIAYHLQSSQNAEFRAMAWSIKAQAAQRRGKWQDAVKFLRKSCSLEKNIDTLLYISAIYTEHKEYDKALEYITEALKITPDSPKALFRQAIIFQERMDYKQAIKLYKKLLKKYPRWSLVLVNLSDIMAAKGKTREALNLAQQAHDESPLWPRSKLCLGLRELDSKNYSKALMIFELFLTREPDNKIIKNAIPRCLIPIIKEHIADKSFSIAKLRLEQLKRSAPNSDKTTALEKLLITEEKASKKPPIKLL